MCVLQSPMKYDPDCTDPVTLSRFGRCHSVPTLGGGPGAVVEAACLESRRSRVRTPLWHSSFNEMFLLCSLVKLQNCGERTLCVWRAVSFHSSPHPQEVLLAQFSLHVHKGWPRTPFISFFPIPPLLSKQEALNKC